MIRVITGRFKGKQLVTLPGLNVRPTMERIREALFSILGDKVRSARVLDLFSGTGALGIEALSRGAADVVFVEKSKTAVKMLKQNIDALGVTECTVFSAPVERVLPRLGAGGNAFDLVFLDPPYRRGLVLKTIKLLARLRLVADGGRIVAQHEARLLPPAKQDEFTRVDWRKYGDTAVSIYTRIRESAGP